MFILLIVTDKLEVNDLIIISGSKPYIPAAPVVVILYSITLIARKIYS